MFARVILASKPTNGAPPIITIHARYPRIIHGEIMTHRVFSRNARSSRAVPVMTMIKEVWNSPFVPWHWGKNQKGMQADVEITGWRLWIGRKLWIFSSKLACVAAYLLYKLGFHKQIGNRLLEPFSFIDTLITSTSWANFFHLRDHDMAEPHFHDLAGLVRAAIGEADFQQLEDGEWHLPYVNAGDYIAVEDYLEPYPETTHPTIDVLKKLSVARCARISYKPFDGNGSIEAEIARHDSLVGSSPLHASPAEHQAMSDEKSTELRLEFVDGTEEVGKIWSSPELGGNLGPGYIQYRKTLAGEYIMDEAA